MIHQALAMEVAREEGIEGLVERAMAMAEGGGGGQPGAGGGAPILGPDGRPLDQTMGGGAMGGGAAGGGMRQGLTPDTINPSQIGASIAG
jgi:hypothetical protein